MKRLDEILEECITAGIEGRRSLEESLDLYPAEAVELEPLLRTALGISDTFQSINPPAGAEQRGLTRFLADASARRRLRDLARGYEDRGWIGRLFQKPVFAGFAAAAAVLVVAAGITAGTMMGGGNDDDPGGSSAVEQPTAGPSDASVTALRSQVDDVNRKLDTGGQIETADLHELSSLIAKLKAFTDEDIAANSADLADTLPDTYELLTGGASGPPAGSDDPAVQDAINTTRDLADAIGLKLPDPIDGTVKTPAPTPVATDQPTSPPTAPPSGNATPVPTPTSPPTQAPTPSATAENRAPPGFTP